MFEKTKAVGKCVAAWTKDHAPELLLAGGYVAGAAALYFTATGTKKTVKVSEELKTRKNDIETKQERNEVYGQAIKQYIVDYAPAAGCAIISGTCFAASYGVLKKRYVGMASMYLALDAAYATYRQRVIEDAGKDKDTYYLTGLKSKKVTVTNEDGTKEKVTQLEPPLSTTEVTNPYVFKFSKYKSSGERNLQWQNNMHLLTSMAVGHEDWFNNVLYSRCTLNNNNEVVMRGAVFLNEVRDLLGEDPSTSGAVTGWLYRPGNYIDFRIVQGYEIDPEDGSEIPYLLIDPNVDGLIYDIVGKFEEVPFKPDLRLTDEDLEYMQMLDSME